MIKLSYIPFLPFPLSQCHVEKKSWDLVTSVKEWEQSVLLSTAGSSSSKQLAEWGTLVDIASEPLPPI